MSEKIGKESQYSFAPLHLPRLGGGGCESWYQSLVLGVSRRVLDEGCTYIVMCWPKADVLILYIT